MERPLSSARPIAREEDHAPESTQYSERERESSPTLGYVFGSEGLINDATTPGSPNARTIPDPENSPSTVSKARSVASIRSHLMDSLGLDLTALNIYLAKLLTEQCTSYLLHDWDSGSFGPLATEDAHRVCLLPRH